MRRRIEDSEPTLTKDGHFSDALVEQGYQDSCRLLETERLRNIALITGIAYALGSIVDIFTISGTALNFMLIAKAVTVLSSLLMFFTAKKSSLQLTVILSLIYLLLISLSESLELLLIPSLQDQRIPFLVFVVISYYVFFPVKMTYRLAGGIAAAAFYLFSLLQAAADPMLLLIVFVLLSLSNLIGFIAASSSEKSSRRLYHANLRIKEMERELQHEIQQKELAGKELKRIATTDQLTSICNRRSFMEHSEIILAKAADTDVCMLLIDIDHFRKVNDTYGHTAGDTILKDVARLIQGQVRNDDCLGRYGGEEFALMLPRCPLSKAREKAEEICRAFEAEPFEVPFEDSQVKIHLTISIGVADASKGSRMHLPELILMADKALYKAKEAGMNRVEIWDREEASEAALE